MTIDEAKNIYLAYAKSFKDLNKGELVQPISDLPCSPGRIRYALFVMAEHIIANDLAESGTLEELITKYALISSRFKEDADKLNSAFKSYASSEKARAYIEKNGGLESLLPSVEDSNEFHNFIADIMGNYSSIV